MAVTLSPSGLDKPQDDDTGATFYDDLEALFDAFNTHIHSGSDSTALVARTQSIASGSWGSADADGLVSQVVTLSNSLQFATTLITIRDDSTNEIIYPKIVRASATTYTISVNDNTLDLTAVYGR